MPPKKAAKKAGKPSQKSPENPPEKAEKPKDEGYQYQGHSHPNP